MAKAYLTWGIGYGKSKTIAETNAQRDANISKIKIKQIAKTGNS
jgi:pyruvoyl-dependent arginine decarboxylase (PvlArgDC)